MLPTACVPTHYSITIPFASPLNCRWKNMHWHSPNSQRLRSDPFRVDLLCVATCRFKFSCRFKFPSTVPSTQRPWPLLSLDDWCLSFLFQGKYFHRWKWRCTAFWWPSNTQPYYNTYGSNGMKFLIQANMHPTRNTCVHGLETEPPSPPPPPVLKQCTNSSSNGSKCNCARGQGTRDGCVCSGGKCVSFCAANNGRRCKACRSVFCKCKRGACKTLLSRWEQRVGAEH